MTTGLEELITRNVAIIEELRRRAATRRSSSQRFADAAFRIVGGMRFVVLHLLGFAVWIVLNTGAVPGIPPWDPWPFVGLTTIVSLEAIVLSSLVLASQNRAQRLADQRADLDLQVNLLAEREVTRVLAHVDAIAKKVGAELPPDVTAEAQALQKDVAPSRILGALATAADESQHLIDPDAD